MPTHTRNCLVCVRSLLLPSPLVPSACSSLSNALSYSSLQACFGALGIHLAERFHKLAQLSSGAPHSSEARPEQGCDWIRQGEALQLPDFPDFGEGFDFTLPPIPRLLPSQQHLQSLLPAEEHFLGQQLRQPTASTSIGMSVSFGLIAGAVVGSLLAIAFRFSTKGGVRCHKGRLVLRG